MPNIITGLELGRERLNRAAFGVFGRTCAERCGQSANYERERYEGWNYFKFNSAPSQVFAHESWRIFALWLRFGIII